MRISLHVTRRGDSSYIYVFPEENEKKELPQIQHQGLALHHNPNERSIKPYRLSANIHHNDYRVTFQRKIAFKQFYQAFEASEYNNPNLYDKLQHNCADSAIFALELCGIDLKFADINFIKPQPSVSISFPFPFVKTPATLFDVAKKLKEKEIRRSIVPAQIKRTASELTFWAQSHNKVQGAQKIVSAIEKNMKTHVHQAEMYWDTLKKVLEDAKNDTLHRDQNQGFFAQLQERVPNQALKDLDRFKDVQYHIILLLFVLMLNPATSHYALLTGVVLSLCNLLCHRGILYENDYSTARVDTELSTALAHFYQ